jgi:plasmid stabilization system protein ParE
MRTVVWTPAAEQDLENIFLYIGREQHSPAAAARVVRNIAEKAGTYAAQPLAAAARPAFGPLVRAFASVETPWRAPLPALALVYNRPAVWKSCSSRRRSRGALLRNLL